MQKLVHPDHLWLPQLVPPSRTRLGLGLGLEARAILISAYASCTVAGRTIYCVTGFFTYFIMPNLYNNVNILAEYIVP